MNYSVQLLPIAEADFEEFYNYLYARSPQGAARWVEAFEAGLERVRRQPETCGRAPEAFVLKRDLWQLLFSTKRGRTYRAIFVIEGNRVFVLRLRGPGQKPMTARDLSG